MKMQDGGLVPNTPEELIEELVECVEKDFYFEIGREDSKVLLEYIRSLQQK